MTSIITKQAADLKLGDTIVEEDGFTLIPSLVIAEPVAVTDGIQIVAAYKDDDGEGLPMSPVTYTLAATEDVEVYA